MENTFLKSIGLVALTLFAAGFAHAANNTPNYWQCNNKVFGSWGNFGVYAEACDVDPFADRRELKGTYSPLVLPNKPSSAQINSYMQEMYAVVREISAYYLKQRKPSVNAAELLAFQEAIFALAHQESFWSHYRDTTVSNLKMIRGDYGHGHGLMQVDDRHHYVSVKSGVGAKLGIHFAYALDIFYEAWQRAPSQSCVSSPSAYLSRTRTAYGAYNGGPGSACRWTNPNHTWYKNDKNYLDKFQKKQWLRHIANKNKKASINIACLSQGHEDCPNQGEPSPPPSAPSDGEYSENIFYMNSRGLFCAYEEENLYCMEQYRDAACLNAKLDRNISQSAPFTSAYKSVPIHVLDRHEVCQENVNGLVAVGESVELLKSINLRDTPAGSLISVVNQGEVVQVIDYDVKNDGSLKRYYKVDHKGQQGYVYVGDNEDYAEWAKPARAPEEPSLLADVGDSITLVLSINQRTTPGGGYIQVIPGGTVLEVEEVATQGTNGYLYYKVSYRGRPGYVYSGQGYPETTYQQWTKVNPEGLQKSQHLAEVSSNVYYKNLTLCDQSGCSESDYFVPGPRMKTVESDRLLEIHQTTDGGWAYVTHLSSGKQGWIPLRDLRSL